MAWPLLEDLSLCVSLLSSSLELFHAGSGGPGGGNQHGPPEKEHPVKQVRSQSGVGLQREERGFLPGRQSKKESLSEISSSPFSGRSGTKASKQTQLPPPLPSPCLASKLERLRSVSPFKWSWPLLPCQKTFLSANSTERQGGCP